MLKPLQTLDDTEGQKQMGLLLMNNSIPFSQLIAYEEPQQCHWWTTRLAHNSELEQLREEGKQSESVQSHILWNF